MTSVSGAAYENGVDAVPLPLQASAQFISCDVVTRASVCGTRSARSPRDTG